MLRQGMDPMIYAQLGASFVGGILGGGLAVLAVMGLGRIWERVRYHRYVTMRRRNWDGKD